MFIDTKQLIVEVLLKMQYFYKMIESIRLYLENHLFGVCSYLGEKLNMPSSRIQLFFIYSSCLAIGSPLIIYLTLAFLIKLKDYVKGKRSPIWDF